MRIITWLKTDPIGRTIVQVIGAFLVAVALDYGLDGHVDITAYVFGDGGLIVAVTVALAAAMNIRRPTRPTR